MLQNIIDQYLHNTFTTSLRVGLPPKPIKCSESKGCGLVRAGIKADCSSFHIGYRVSQNRYLLMFLKH